MCPWSQLISVLLYVIMCVLYAYRGVLKNDVHTLPIFPRNAAPRNPKRAGKKDNRGLSPRIFHFMTNKMYHHDCNGHIVLYQSLRSHDIIIWQSCAIAKKELKQCHFL